MVTGSDPGGILEASSLQVGQKDVKSEPKGTQKGAKGNPKVPKVSRKGASGSPKARGPPQGALGVAMWLPRRLGGPDVAEARSDIARPGGTLTAFLY